MKINSEWQLLDAIKDAVNRKGIKAPDDLNISIGDDCAVFQIDSKICGLITTDISIQSIHFLRDLISLEDVGFKAMMGNISDITAMGGLSKFAFISLGIPEDMSEEDVLSIYDGLIDAANRTEAVIAGGDISKSRELLINISIYGEVAQSRLIRRDGAKRGDVIYVTGSLGDSRAGLEIIHENDSDTIKPFPELVLKHIRPIARFDIVNEIINMFNPTSMIDISDGLLSDMRHITEASSVGFNIIEENLPISDELISYSLEMKTADTTLQYALNSGEEYELLFTSDKRLVESMSLNINSIPITPIGEIIDSGFYLTRNNQPNRISISGFDHFIP
ncbi:MAG: thiamine-phosphate kinase [Spirochaetota bacterium]|nr:thiamine-phosphate kinase [Spirochaetota bacterium]